MSQCNDHNRLIDSDDTTLSHIQACDLKGTCSVNTMIYSIWDVLHCKLSCALEKKNPILLSCELFKYKTEPEFKKRQITNSYISTETGSDKKTSSEIHPEKG